MQMHSQIKDSTYLEILRARTDRIAWRRGGLRLENSSARCSTPVLGRMNGDREEEGRYTDVGIKRARPNDDETTHVKKLSILLLQLRQP